MPELEFRLLDEETFDEIPAPTQPGARSPVRYGSTSGVASPGGAVRTSASSGLRRNVSCAQLTARPTSLIAPPSSVRRASTR